MGGKITQASLRAEDKRLKRYEVMDDIDDAVNTSNYQFDCAIHERSKEEDKQQWPDT